MSYFPLDKIGRGLPVAQHEEGITQALRGGSAVIQAPPGTGKTTFVPPLVANQLGGKVLVVAPRRVAVRAAARHLAQLSGGNAHIGFSIRGERQRGDLVEFLTPGVLLRRLLRDPELPGVSAVIVDEVHERQLEVDMLLGMLAELRQLREELCVIAMSATVDAEGFAELLSATVVDIESPIHPLEISYSPLAGRAECSREFLASFASTCATAFEGGDSVLAFLPGLREVTAVCEHLSDFPVFPLHGQLSGAEQDRALTHPGQRIVVATSIAESSITVPGVRVVVDSGLARVPKRDNMRGMSGLVTLSCSQSSAVQRAGRAGREGPGRVIRCYSQREFSAFAPQPAPEILSAELSECCLMLSSWGVNDPALFPFLDQPPARAWNDARSTLEALGAIDTSGITELGSRIVTLPTHPRLGRVLVEADPRAAEVIAALSLDTRGDIAAALPRLRGTPAFEREAQRLRAFACGSQELSVGAIIGRAYPEFVAKQSSNGYLSSRGTRLESFDAGPRSPWLAVADLSLSASNRAIIRSYAEISEAEALEILGVREEVLAEFGDSGLRATRVRRAGAITLSSTPVSLDPGQARAAILETLRDSGLADFHLSPAARSLAQRMQLLHEHVGAPWPDMAQVFGGPVEEPELWLGPEVELLARGTPAAKIDLEPAIRRLLPWPEASHFEELAPARLAVPSGRSVAIAYAERPVVRVKLQECFGLAESPVICGQKVQFHLLSPAGRPLAVTDDLASFWQGPYQGVRSEMRGRYPKHPWPEDPLDAVATHKTKNSFAASRGKRT